MFYAFTSCFSDLNRVMVVALCIIDLIVFILKIQHHIARNMITYKNYNILHLYTDTNKNILLFTFLRKFTYFEDPGVDTLIQWENTLKPN